MFQRRNSHKPTLDLLTSFKDSFPRFSHCGIEAHIFPVTPLQTATVAEITMSYNQSGNYNHLGDNEDNFDHVFNAHDSQTELFEHQSPDTTMALFDQMSTPYQRTPNASSYYQQNHMTNQPRAYPAQPGLMTPLSGTDSHAGNNQGMQNYMSIHDFQQMHQISNAAYSMGQFDMYPQSMHEMSTTYGYNTGQGSVNPSRLDAPQAPGFGSSFMSRDTQHRFRVILKTGTAMFKEGEQPVTYLNKCQPYRILIQDTRPERHHWPTTYRSFIRVSFNEQQQRERPAPCWQLWKEGRGMSEAHQRGGKLQAVEFVQQNQNHQHGTTVDLEHQSFDGFSITWTVAPGARAECEFQMRCNFLSTDFSHSKGVKGIPVRLCAKTEPFGAVSMAPPSAEISYCKVKLFRDHGAERKLSNDESHVKKSIAKLEEQIKQSQIEQEEVAVNSSGKRQRSDSTSMAGRPSKIAKNRRASSVSSNSSSGIRGPIEGDLQTKLDALTNTLHSKQENSILNLKGEDLDDPDLHPVRLEGASLEILGTESPQDLRLSRRSTQLTDRSPSTSVLSINSPNRRPSNYQIPTPINTASKQPSNEWPASMKAEEVVDIRATNPQHLASPPDQLRRTEQRLKVTPGNEKQSIDVVDVDPSYVPPTPRKIVPVACFYVRTSMHGKASSEPYYRAIYLYERTVGSFTKSIALKNGLAPSDIAETIFIREQDQDDGSADIEIMVDDEMISEMAEGQDILADFSMATGYLDRTKQDASTAYYRLVVRF